MNKEPTPSHEDYEKAGRLTNPHTPTPSALREKIAEEVVNQLVNHVTLRGHEDDGQRVMEIIVSALSRYEEEGEKERIRGLINTLAGTEHGSVTLRYDFRGNSKEQAAINDLLDFAKNVGPSADKKRRESQSKEGEA